MRPTAALLAALDRVERVVCARQHPVSGLLPASTAVTRHGDYTHAWVRDGVYSIVAVWGAARAARRAGLDGGRVRELEQRTVALMRGHLRSMMAQADRVERFKVSQDPLDALHAKVDTATGAQVVADDAWGHLQLDATGLYLLTLAQITAGGLPVVATLDEVAFVQNLVWYVARAHRTPDYGIWERGDKTNHGLPEINASSVAACMAALEALDGLDLFGAEGSQASVVHVMPDDIARARVTLEALLPRESASKETDAALLSAVGWPAFAVDDPALERRTRETIRRVLDGRYGMKRFLRDGHQTALEEEDRLHYEPEELARFDGIESEWPLFHAFAGLDAAFRGAWDEARGYRDELRSLSVNVDGLDVLPELYRVAEADIERERAAPGSCDREPGENVPLVWAESLRLLLELLVDGALLPDELDPIGRHRRSPPREARIQIAIVAEDDEVQRALHDRGVAAERLGDLGEIELVRAAEVANAYEMVGRNAGLGLSGRPPMRLGSLASARLYRLSGRRCAVVPTFLDRAEFYLSLDPVDLLERLRVELRYLSRHWDLPGRPTLVVLIPRDLLDHGEDALLRFVREIATGEVAGVPVTSGPLARLALAANEERIDRLEDWTPGERPLAGAERHRARPLLEVGVSTPLSADDELSLELMADPDAWSRRLRSSDNLYEQAELLALIVGGRGVDAIVWTDEDGPVRADTLLEELYDAAADRRAWGVVRLCAALLGMVEPTLSDAASDLFAAQKRVSIGKAYSDASTLSRPIPQPELLELIARFCREDVRDRVLTQELIVALAGFLRADPDVFQGIRTVRLGQFTLLLASQLAHEQGVSQDEGYERLASLAPSEVRRRLRALLRGPDQRFDRWVRQHERLPVEVGGTPADTRLDRPPADAATADAATEEAPASGAERDDAAPSPVGPNAEPPAEGWWRWREREGSLARLPDGFAQRVWRLLTRCEALVIGDKLERRNRLDSARLTGESTPGELNFALRVEHLLHKIPSPEYRQVTIEAIDELAALFERTPTLRLRGALVMDVVVGHAVRAAWLRAGHAEDAYEQEKAAAWGAFYAASPVETRAAVRTAFDVLTEERGVASP